MVPRPTNVTCTRCRLWLSLLTIAGRDPGWVPRRDPCQRSEGFRYRKIRRRGAQLCVIVHGSVLDQASKDLASQSVAEGIPTYLIDSDTATPKRLSVEDPRLK